MTVGDLSCRIQMKALPLQVTKLIQDKCVIIPYKISSNTLAGGKRLQNSFTFIPTDVNVTLHTIVVTTKDMTMSSAGGPE